VAVVLAVPVGAVLGRGVAEKLASAARVLVPGTKLYGWRGADGYLDFHRFFGFTDPAVLGFAGALGVLALAALALRRAPREAGVGLAAMGGAMLAFAVYFRIRSYGDLFYYKDLAFLGPLAVALAGAGVVAVGRRAPLVAGVAVAIATVGFGAGLRTEYNYAYDQVTPGMLALRGWSATVPADRSIRIDVPPTGVQLWTGHMLYRHPLSVSRPLTGAFFPEPPTGRKAYYIVAMRVQRRPADAAGRAVYRNDEYVVYRERVRVPGRDVSSRRMVEPVTKISLD
jgi:hypothetical protein